MVSTYDALLLGNTFPAPKVGGAGVVLNHENFIWVYVPRPNPLQREYKTDEEKKKGLNKMSEFG